ncbi:ricin B-like lectin R40C1 [Phragmites australis]|uniref:ricin B-like lectin R40C1 n=1 Tax=Phragmites australis TaxID=29695 RepID=UPI002D798AE4|nr:ricin B-like lectin R40C1 [Phragmites australis]
MSHWLPRAIKPEPECEASRKHPRISRSPSPTSLGSFSMFGHGHHHGHGHHQPPPPPGPHGGGGYPPMPQNEPTFKIFCRADEGYCLTVRHDAVVLAPTNSRDQYQHWYKDMRHSTRVKDEEGHPAFALVNRATGLAIKHSLGQSHPVKLFPYNPEYLDESVLWTESRDVGKGFRCIRMVNNIHLNFDAFHGDKDHGGVHDGTTVVLWEWAKGPNQSWKILPWGDEAYAPPPAYGSGGYGYPGGSQAGSYPPPPPAQEPGYGYRPPPGGPEGYAPPPAQEPGYGYRPPPGGPEGYAPPPAQEPGYGYRPPPGGPEGYGPPPAQEPGYGYRPPPPGYGAGYGYSNLPRELASQSTVRIYCKAGEDYSLTVRNGTVCLAPTNPRDDYQHWVKEMRHSTSIKDEEGYPAFALVNKVTGEAIKHSLGQSHPVRLVPYNPEYVDESVLWTESRDVGKGFRCVRMVNNIYLNFDAFHGDKDHGGVHDGTTVVLWEWAKGDNQRWKIVPW